MHRAKGIFLMTNGGGSFVAEKNKAENDTGNREVTIMSPGETLVLNHTGLRDNISMVAATNKISTRS